jgi:hypothetical protein
VKWWLVFLLIKSYQYINNEQNRKYVTECDYREYLKYNQMFILNKGKAQSDKIF